MKIYRKKWVFYNLLFTLYIKVYTDIGSYSCKNKFLRLTWPKITKVSFHQNPILIKFRISTNIFFKSTFFVFVLQCIQREKMFTMKTTIHSYLFVEDDNPLHICSWKTTIPLYLFLGDDNSFIFGRGRRQSLHICLWKTTIPIHLFMEDENSYIFGRGRRQSLHMYWC